MHVDQENANLRRIAILVGVGMIVYGCWVDIPQGIRNRNWPVAPGEVTRARIVTEDTGTPHGGQATFARIDFSYDVAGKNYRGKWEPRKNLAMWGMPGSIIEKYPPGTALAVYYSPADPQVFVMERGITWATILALVAGGALAAFGGYKEWRHRRGRKGFHPTRLGSTPLG